MEAAQSGRHSQRRGLWRSFRAFAQWRGNHPATLCITGGGAACQCHGAGDACHPGIQLAGMGRPKLFDKDVILVSLIRLLAGPALAIVLAAPFGLSGVERGAGIIQASMPAAVLTSLIALEHDLLPDFVTTTVLFSTILSSITLTLVLALV